MEVDYVNGGYWDSDLGVDFDHGAVVGVDVHDAEDASKHEKQGEN